MLISNLQLLFNLMCLNISNYVTEFLDFLELTDIEKIQLNNQRIANTNY